MLRLALGFAAVALLTEIAPASANPQPGDQTIVVNATPLDPEQVRQRAVDFVKNAGVATGQKQVARWVAPVCIKIAGISAAQAAKIESFMLGVAREANIPVAKEGCEPNIAILFTAGASQDVQQVHQHRPRQLIELSHVNRERVLYGTAPIRWWYSTQDVDREGVGTENVVPLIPMSIGGMGEMKFSQQYGSGSNVRTSTIRSLFTATVVIDAPLTGNTPIDAISAYAAMVAFAEINAGAPPPDSILGLFQPSSIESTLTDWDMAFLKSLYRMPLDRRSRIQRGHLVEALLDERVPEKDRSKRP